MKAKTNVMDRIREMESRDVHPGVRKRYDAAKAAIESLGDALNGGGRDDTVAAVVEGWLRTHRYLANEVVVTLLTAMGEIGALPENEVSDPRNKFAYELCQKVRRSFRDELFWKDPA